jgi:acyl-coenzyme A thioesterase PaaI-like protein
MFHGGILASLLDEVMIKAVIAKGLVVVTVGMEIAFKKPVKIGQKILLTGKMTEQKKRIILTEGEAHLANGDIVATASGKYFVVDEKMKQKLQESLEKT